MKNKAKLKSLPGGKLKLADVPQGSNVIMTPMDKAKNKKNTVVVGDYDTGYTQEEIANLPDEEFSKLQSKLLEVANANTDDSALAAIEQARKQAEHPTDIPTKEVVNVQVDIETGTTTTLPIKKDELSTEERLDALNEKAEKVLNATIDDVLSGDINSFSDINVNEELMKKIILENVKDENIKLQYCSDEDVTKLIAIIMEYRKLTAKERYDAFWYADLPDTLKTAIDNQLKLNGTARQKMNYMRQLISNSFLEKIVQDSGLEQIAISISRAFDIKADVNEVMSIELNDAQCKLEKYFDNLYEEYKAADNKVGMERSLECKKAYRESWTFEELVSLVQRHKIKIHKDLDVKNETKFLSCYNHLFEMYEHNTMWTMHHPHIMFPIIYRHFKDIYTANDIRRFLVAFTRYIDYKNMNPDDIAASMYIEYFMHNVTFLDMHGSSTDEDNFINRYRNNICQAIYDINVACGAIKVPPKKKEEE